MPENIATGYGGGSDTQTQILDTATRLFAIKGFKSVSLKEIAKAVGIKTPSIYYYYSDKDILIEAVLERFGEVYRECHSWLSKRNAQAGSVDEVIGNLFDREFFNRLSPVVRLGMSLTLKEQHGHESAYQTAVRHIYEGGIRNVQAGFDRLIEKGLIPPSDTKTLATIFMFCVMCGNDVHILYRNRKKFSGEFCSFAHFPVSPFLKMLVCC